MEAFEAAKVVYNRILETENETITRKIMGYIYLLDHADREMIRLAFGPDNLVQSLIQKAKIDLNLIAKPIPSPPISPSFEFRPIFQSNLPFLPSQIPPPMPLNALSDDFRYQNQDFFVGLGAQFDTLNREKMTGFSERGNDVYTLDRKDGVPLKICHYFSKGHCKHGNNCKFFHQQSISDFNSNNEFDDQAAFSPGSLEKLEFEITEILKSRRGNPISIASLPMIYYERYGRTLQAEGYLTESQRHGKAGYSLTKLLARLKNSIRLIDRGSGTILSDGYDPICRPHGQHSVVLADDASRFMENRFERANMSPGPIVSGSKQIYLTFPAESTFTEDDVANYFSTYGLVQDVRIPCQQKRMFGFVTFHNAETVKVILSKGNPHYVCGARVLVKPYREKLKLFDRKYFEKLEAPMGYHPHHMDMDHDLQAQLDASRLFGRQFEEPELAMQLEMMRLSQLQLAREPSYLENTLDDQRPSEDEADNSNFQSPKHASHHLDHAGTNYNPQDSDNNRGLNLPDSPFACNKGGSNKQM